MEVPCAPADALPAHLCGRARAAAPEGAKLRSGSHKYLRAHLPELRDLGEDFPTPERFGAFGFRWMDFHRLGDGRLALMAGASPAGLHLFWLGAGGFEKSAFFPCDKFPDPVVRLDGERIVVMTSEGGAQRVHEMLWWGP